MVQNSYNLSVLTVLNFIWKHKFRISIFTIFNILIVLGIINFIYKIEYNFAVKPANVSFINERILANHIYNTIDPEIQNLYPNLIKIFEKSEYQTDKLLIFQNNKNLQWEKYVINEIIKIKKNLDLDLIKNNFSSNEKILEFIEKDKQSLQDFEILRAYITSSNELRIKGKTIDLEKFIIVFSKLLNESEKIFLKTSFNGITEVSKNVKNKFRHEITKTNSLIQILNKEILENSEYLNYFLAKSETLSKKIEEIKLQQNRNSLKELMELISLKTVYNYEYTRRKENGISLSNKLRKLEDKYEKQIASLKIFENLDMNYLSNKLAYEIKTNWGKKIFNIDKHNFYSVKKNVKTPLILAYIVLLSVFFYILIIFKFRKNR